MLFLKCQAVRRLRKQLRRPFLLTTCLCLRPPLAITLWHCPPPLEAPSQYPLALQKLVSRDAPASVRAAAFEERHSELVGICGAFAGAFEYPRRGRLDTLSADKEKQLFRSYFAKRLFECVLRKGDDSSLVPFRQLLFSVDIDFGDEEPQTTYLFVSTGNHGAGLVARRLNIISCMETHVDDDGRKIVEYLKDVKRSGIKPDFFTADCPERMLDMYSMGTFA